MLCVLLIYLYPFNISRLWHLAVEVGITNPMDLLVLMSEVLLIFLAAYFFTELFLLEVLLICSAFYFANYLNIPMLGYLLGMCFILLG